MKKVIYTHYGTFDDLQLADVPTPIIQSDELLIQVKAVAMNPIDWKRLEGQLKMMTGSKFPKGVAIDFSGVVAQKGDTISNFEVGDAVFGGLDAMKGEALAEWIVVKADALCKKPESVSFETAAAAVTTTVTALHLLEKCNLKHGEHLLINGASGGVGMAVLQMAKKQGIKVSAVASGAGLEFIQTWQPDVSIDYRKQNVMAHNGAYHAVIELAGSLPFGKAKNILHSPSVHVSTLPAPVDMLKALLNNLFSSKKSYIMMAKPTPEHLRQTSAWLTDQGLEVPIAQQFALADFKAAYQFAKNRGAVGKVVISI